MGVLVYCLLFPIAWWFYEEDGREGGYKSSGENGVLGRKAYEGTGAEKIFYRVQNGAGDS